MSIDLYTTKDRVNKKNWHMDYLQRYRSIDLQRCDRFRNLKYQIGH